MKKHLTALALLISGVISAQIWTQDFSTVTTPNIPGGWIQNNVDGLTVTSSLASYSFGTNAWITRDLSSFDPAHGKVAISTSWYTPPGTANDWLISPSFTVPANAVLEWEALITDPTYADGYLVKISTTGNSVASFSTTLFSIAAENDSWTSRAVSLNAFAGQTVNIAFVNNSIDKDRLVLDNIKVFVPQSDDGSVVDITSLTRYSAGIASQTIAGTFKSFGYNPASNVVLNYQVNNNPVVTEQTIFSTPLNYAQAIPYSFVTPAAMSLGENKIKVWVSQVNSLNEVISTNDTAYSAVYVASQSKPRNALIEEFSSSTCVPCANLNVNFDPLLNANNPNNGGTLNVIKYQVNWPNPGNDPSYNSHSKNRVDHYEINSAPTALTNGKTEMISHNQTEINAAIAEPAFAAIAASLNVIGTNVSASATITPYLTIPSNSPLRVHQALLQKSYNFPGAATSQKNYYHIMRKMNPNGWGAPINSVTDGLSFNASFNHTITTVNTPTQFSFDFWNATSSVYEYVVFVQDSISNDILQSASASFTATSVGLVDLKADKKVGVYPNPAKDFVAVAVNLQNASSIDIAIYDVSGKQVYVNKGAIVEAGKNEIKINTTDFAFGTYNIIINTDEGVLTEKLIIAR